LQASLGTNKDVAEATGRLFFPFVLAVDRMKVKKEEEEQKEVSKDTLLFDHFNSEMDQRQAKEERRRQKERENGQRQAEVRKKIRKREKVRGGKR